MRFFVQVVVGVLYNDDMSDLKRLLENNRQWVDRVNAEDPSFFSRLVNAQNPPYLWIGCSDSRVPANQIVGLVPGEVFVHRNIANMVVHTDLNCLSVIQFAVDVLKVRHIIVVGHYGCSGLKAALEHQRHGLVDNWLGHVHDVVNTHQDFIESREDADWQYDRLCELNVLEQVMNVAETTVVQDAWERGQSLSVNGWIYGVKHGLIQDLNLRMDNIGQQHEVRDRVLKEIHER